MNEKFKIKLAAIAKDESFYLPLWIYHHFYFGFDAIDIRINNITDNSLKVLESLKEIYGDSLSFRVVDHEVDSCKQRGVDFQIYIYNKIYEETLNEDFTHLIFLDIDEYWCSKNFSNTIKDFLKETSDFDVCMFQWFTDNPNYNRKIDYFAFQYLIIGRKGRHVKSLLNLKASIECVFVHNFFIKNGKYILSDKSTIYFSDENKSRATLPKEIFEKNRLKLDEYFIHHQIFRSQEEYIASLLRGNKQNGDDSILKVNRNGYCLNKSKFFSVRWYIINSFLDKYNYDYLKLISNFANDHHKSKLLLIDRKNKVLNLLKDSLFIQQVYEKKMQGISKDIYENKIITNNFKIKIHQLIFNEYNLNCSFICNLISEKNDFILQITQGFNCVLVPATILLLNTNNSTDLIEKEFKVTINIKNLLHVYYHNHPPFCLVTKVKEEFIVLERMAFCSIAPIVAIYAEKIRRCSGQGSKSAKYTGSALDELKQ